MAFVLRRKSNFGDKAKTPSALSPTMVKSVNNSVLSTSATPTPH